MNFIFKFKVDVLRTQIDTVIQDEYLTTTDTNDSEKDMIPTRDSDEILSIKKKTITSDDQNLVTGELVQVLHSKQSRIDELEQRLKQVEQQESQWKVRKLFNSYFLLENILSIS